MFSLKRLTLEADKFSSGLTVQATVSDNVGDFVGFEEDVREIIDHLVSGREGLTIISISGMAGQGKTTLVKRIYSDPSIHYHFHQQVWCGVSKECEILELLETIALDIGLDVSVDDEVQDVIENVWRSLKGKRYMIVLDDIWDVEVWRQVEGCFPNDKNGSRVVFTSRNHYLSAQAGANSISYHLRPFSHEESRALMRDKLCNCDGFPPGFLEIGEHIADLCKGLPLAISLIGPLLRRAGPELNLWKQVATNLNAYLSGEGCMDIVELSYIYLPDHLKPCFLYIGAFPRSSDIRAQTLKLLWIAEGFVKEGKMQLAEEYLDYLVSQNLVVVTQRSSTGGIKDCRVHHDLVYDLCLEKAVKDNFLHLADENVALSTQRYGFLRRLCVTNDGCFTLPESTSAKMEQPKCQLHSLVFNYESVLSTKDCESFGCYLNNFRALTVLHLKDLWLNVFPDVIFDNIHIRYLALRGEIENIPASIVCLWNLETLIVKSKYVVRIPNKLWKMGCLNYVDVSRSSLQGSWPNKISGSMEATGNIEIVKGITLKYDHSTEEFLRSLIRLRKLKCRCDKEEGIHPMWFSMFGSLEKLESLHLYISWRLDDCHVFLRLPNLNFPKNLKKLTLAGFELPWSAMSTIGNLSSLRVLKLFSEACAGTVWHLGEGEFSKLKYLKLESVGVERIDDSDSVDPFPCLEKLFLSNCQNLRDIPSSFAEICTLNTIDVFQCPKVLDTLRRVVEHQREMGNDLLHVSGLD